MHGAIDSIDASFLREPIWYFGRSRVCQTACAWLSHGGVGSRMSPGVDSANHDPDRDPFDFVPEVSVHGAKYYSCNGFVTPYIVLLSKCVKPLYMSRTI